MIDFNIQINAVDLNFLSLKLSISTYDLITALHDMSIEHVEYVNKKALKAKHGCAIITRIRPLLNTDIKVKLNVAAYNQETDVKIKIIGNKLLEIPSSKITTAIVENTLLKA